MLTIFFRAIIIFVVLLVVIRLMGKRQLGEMEPFELVITLVIAEIACIPMGDSSLPLSYGIISILTLFFMHQLINIIGSWSITLRRILSGKPAIIIDKNGIRYKELQKLSMSVNDIQQSMRSLGYFNFDEVMYGILEGNGKLSILPNAPKDSEPEQAGMPISLVLEGKVMKNELEKAGLTEEALSKEIEKTAPLKFPDILYLGMNSRGKMYIQPKKGKYIVHTMDGVQGDW